MGHHSAQMGHHFAKMGHEGTPTDIKMVSHVVMVKGQANKGLSTRFLGLSGRKNQVTVPKADPRQFCNFGCLWYNLLYEFSAQQGWRHGVRSRSLGGIPVTSNRVRTWEIRQETRLQEAPDRPTQLIEGRRAG